MASYIQLERTIESVIGSNEAILFDRIVSSAGSQISYDAGTGVITFNDVGYYYLDWFVAPQFGLTTDGSNFAIVSSDDSPALTGSSHVRVAQTSGFAVIVVTTPGKTVRLVNTSDNSLTLSHYVNAKAALAAFFIAEPDASTE